MTKAQEEMLELAERIENADFLMTRDCPMVTKFDHENVDVYLSGEEHNQVVAALRLAAQPQDIARAKTALDNIARLHGYSLTGVELNEAVRAVARALALTRPDRKSEA